MPKFNCSRCNYGADSYWIGRCPGCGRNYSIVKERTVEDHVKASLSNALHLKKPEFISTGMKEFDQVLGGGLLLGCMVLVGGPRGTGKSTLLLQTAINFAKLTKKVVYASGEEQRESIEHRTARLAKQLGITDENEKILENVYVLGNEGNIEEICNYAEEVKAELIIVDSIQTAYKEDVEAAIGQVTQIDAATNWLQSFGITKKVASIIVGHINKTGDFAGSEKLQHLCDTIVYGQPYPMMDDEGEARLGTENVVKWSIDGKNRNGDKNAVSYMEMSAEGLKSLGRKAARYYLTPRIHEVGE